MLSGTQKGNFELYQQFLGSWKLFREKFADYAVDNPKMEKEI